MKAHVKKPVLNYATQSTSITNSLLDIAVRLETSDISSNEDCANALLEVSKDLGTLKDSIDYQIKTLKNSTTES